MENNFPLDYNYGLEIDKHVKIKTDAKVNLVRSSARLLELGAKIIVGGQLTALPGFNTELYEQWNLQEFSWQAVYEDSSIHQFEASGDHHFGDIDQDRLLKFRWISCFDAETSNEEKKVTVELDFKTGKFYFQNALVPQEVRAVADEGYPELMRPKLIMKAVKRTSETIGLDGIRAEVLKYNRYIIGWESTPESPTQIKKLLCVEPNGFVHLWHEK